MHQEPRTNYANNKTIPPEILAPVLDALAGYPELADTRIVFKLSKEHPVPYGTTPSVTGVFRARKNRVYHITLLSQAAEPERAALFMNLPRHMQTAVIAHELYHVLQFQSCSVWDLVRTLLGYSRPVIKKRIESGADLGAIRHGFGEQLLAHAIYIRSIPGYLSKRPELKRHYLEPHQIREYIERLEREREPHTRTSA